PLTITGVRARASRPTATLKRSTSKAFSHERKLVPKRENRTTSAASKTASRPSWVGGLGAEAGSSVLGDVADIFAPLEGEAIGGDRHEDDAALDRLFPVRLGAQKNQGSADGGQQQPPQ